MGGERFSFTLELEHKDISLKPLDSMIGRQLILKRKADQYGK
jgi:hypothetical protein